LRQWKDEFVLARKAAERIAAQAHGQDRNKGGDLFIDHVRRVASMVEDDPDPYAVTAALLHDAVEKGSSTWKQLRLAGADDRLIDVVDALTERKGESDRTYLARCAADPLAYRIKRADLLDKLNPSGRLDPSQQAKREMRARRRLKVLQHLHDR
jgi:(p)ppGpp synthase/HD superfamily hydrolase